MEKRWSGGWVGWNGVIEGWNGK